MKRHFGHFQAQLPGHAHGSVFAQRRVRWVTLLLQFGNPLLTLVQDGHLGPLSTQAGTCGAPNRLGCQTAWAMGGQLGQRVPQGCRGWGAEAKLGFQVITHLNRPRTISRRMLQAIEWVRQGLAA